MNITKILFAFYAFVVLASPCANAQSAGERQTASLAAFGEPAISPDNMEIAFVSGGDIWTVPTKGGEARLLVSHPDNESRPLYSPDGKYLAFNSTRTGNGDIYVLNMTSGELKRLTYDDSNEELNAWSRDGRYLYFSSSGREISGMRDVYRVKAGGGTPMTVSDTRYTNEFFAQPSPAGVLAFSGRGVAVTQWWRNGHSHLDESEIWLMHEGKPARYEKIVDGGAKQLWPMWSKDGQSVYFVSDQSGKENLWVRPLNGSVKQLTKFTNGRVLWPTMSYDGKLIVFERDFKIWIYDVASGQSTPVNIIRRGSAASPSPEHVRLTSQFRDLALSPDGKKVAFTAHGDVFVAASKDGGDATRVTTTAANEGQLEWARNSNSIVYISDRDGPSHLYEYNFITLKETRLTNSDQDDFSPLFSPDGKSLAYLRAGQELRVIDRNTKSERLVTKGNIGRPPFTSTGAISWSPDNKWIAFAGYGAKAFNNIYIVSASGGQAKPVSFLANSSAGNVSWSSDGKYILFNTGQRTENSFVARIDLIQQLPRFREDQFRDMFTEQSPPVLPSNVTPKPTTPVRTPSMDSAASKAAKDTSAKNVKITWEGIRQRLSLLPLGVDAGEQVISKDGNTLLVIASVAGQRNLYTYSLDELSKEPAVLKQLTTTAAFKSDPQFTPDGKEVFYLEQGRIQSINIDSKVARPLAVTAEMDVDFNQEKYEVFKQAWDIQNNGFYDPKFHGADWQEIKKQYEPYAAGSNTPDELRRIISLMIGELNASHSGISGPTPATVSTGRIGVRFDRAEYENSGKLKITEVISSGPVALSGTIQVGDYLSRVDELPIDAGVNVDHLLENKANKRVVLTITSGSGGEERKIIIRAVTQAVEKGLLYKQWVQQQREYVAKVSHGRLGYVHMFDMSQQSLDQLYIDMDAENHSREGVVVDVRNNNGGFVNAYALDVLSRKGYMTMTARGLPSAPARTSLGQRALDAPTVLVTNQHSLSDAEDFSEGYRTLKLGKIVGEPTGGWIIYTGSVQLIDGSSERLPTIRITDHEGKDMELHPRPVDIAVTRPFGESDQNIDSQLDTAVRELLKQIDGKK